MNEVEKWAKEEAEEIGSLAFTNPLILVKGEIERRLLTAYYEGQKTGWREACVEVAQKLDIFSKMTMHENPINDGAKDFARYFHNEILVLAKQGKEEDANNHKAQCCVCGKVAHEDTGDFLDDGIWVCSDECWKKHYRKTRGNFNKG
jgi:hypothetical protein